MNIVRSLMNPVAGLRSVAMTLLVVGVLCPLQAMSQVPPRLYWKTLSGANAVPLIVTSMSGNTNPFDAAHTVTPGADFEGTLALAGYARTFALLIARPWQPSCCPWGGSRATSSRRAARRFRSR